MAVFTAVTKKNLAGWLQDYTLGELIQIQGIAAGIENSNFFLTFDALPKQMDLAALSLENERQQSDYVLTLFERLAPEALPFYLELMLHLSRHGVQAPEPILRKDGELFGILCGKPAAIVTKLEGKAQLHPTPHHCRQVGAMLAKMHEAGRDFQRYQPNLRSLSWWIESAPSLRPFLTMAQRTLLDDELNFQKKFFASQAYAALGRGPCHCDLFRDNVLFKSGMTLTREENGFENLAEYSLSSHQAAYETDSLSGFLDFYFAGYDAWLFDLAVCVNDWCIHLESGEFDESRLHALIGSYQSVRRLSAIEVESFGAMLRAGALRFWISRLYDFYLPREATLLAPHDPSHFEQILRRHRGEKLCAILAVLQH